MKLGLSYITPLLLCLFQSTQATNLFQIEAVEGEDTPFGSMLCFLIPCMDEELGWKNIFAPVAIDPNAESLPEAVDPTTEESTAREQLTTLAVDLLNTIVSNQRQDGGNRRYLRNGETNDDRST